MRDSYTSYIASYIYLLFTSLTVSPPAVAVKFIRFNNFFFSFFLFFPRSPEEAEFSARRADVESIRRVGPAVNLTHEMMSSRLYSKPGLLSERLRSRV